MSANRIVHPEAVSAAPGRVAAIVLTSALVVIAVVGGALVTLRDNNSDGAASVSPVESSPWFPGDFWSDMVPDVLRVPVPVDPIAGSLRQIVVVASYDDISRVSSMFGMDAPGIATEYLVVNDEASQSKFHEIQRSLAEPGARPTSIIDLR